MASLLALPPAAAAASGVTDTEILIRSCAALEGPAKFLGTQTVMGAMAYIINGRGWIHGRTIRG